MVVMALILCGTFLSLLSGEEKQPKTGGPFEAELNGSDSKYWMYVPEEYTPVRSLPLMVLVPGCGMPAKEIILRFIDEAKKSKYILATVPDSKDHVLHSDERIVLSTIDNVRKDYMIDPDRIFMSGFSVGGAVTCYTGFKNHDIFRGIAPLAGAVGASVQGHELIENKVFQDASKHLTVLLVCGNKDQNYPAVKQVYKTLQQETFDTEFYTMYEVGHALDKNAVPWLFKKFQERCNKPEELLKRGKNATSDKRYLDAIDCFNKIIEDKKLKKEDKIAIQAKEELKNIDKIASEKYEASLKEIDSNNKDEAIELLKEIVTQFEKTSVWAKAKDKLKEIESSD